MTFNMSFSEIDPETLVNDAAFQRNYVVSLATVLGNDVGVEVVDLIAEDNVVMTKVYFEPHERVEDRVNEVRELLESTAGSDISSTDPGMAQFHFLMAGHGYGTATPVTGSFTINWIHPPPSPPSPRPSAPPPLTPPVVLLGSPDIPPAPSDGGPSRTTVIIVASVSVGALVIVALGAALVLSSRKYRRIKSHDREATSEAGGAPQGEQLPTENEE
jgi:hypothetical protein